MPKWRETMEFQKASDALCDCIDAIDEAFLNDDVKVKEFYANLSAAEQRAFRRLHSFARRFLDLYADMQ
jgi:hypothetical protein